MTLVVGWLHKNDCIIAADNMVSGGPFSISMPMTFSKQSIINSALDAVFKLFRISNNCIASFAGEQVCGFRIIKSIIDKGELLTFDSLIEALESLDKWQSNKYQETTVLLGFYDTESKRNHLLTFNCQTHKIDQGEYFALGTGSTDRLRISQTGDSLKDDFRGYLKDIQSDPNVELLLKSIRNKIGVLSLLMNQYIFGKEKDLLSRLGVGGVFYGVGLNQDGVKWQEKTIIVLIEYVKAGYFESSHIRVFCNESEKLLIRSSIDNTIRVFYNDIHKPTRKIQIDSAAVEEILKCDDCELALTYVTNGTDISCGMRQLVKEERFHIENGKLQLSQSIKDQILELSRTMNPKK